MYLSYMLHLYVTINVLPYIFLFIYSTNHFLNELVISYICMVWLSLHLSYSFSLKFSVLDFAEKTESLEINFPTSCLSSTQTHVALLPISKGKMPSSLGQRHPQTGIHPCLHPQGSFSIELSLTISEPPALHGFLLQQHINMC